MKPGNVLATLVDTSRLRLRFKVSEGESLRARAGQEVTFRVAALGQRDFTGQIYHVGEVADPATRQVEVLAWVKNPGVLKPGFFAEVDAGRPRSHEGRAGRARRRGPGQRARLRGLRRGRDGKARAAAVQLGLRTGDGVVEILSGLEAGRDVVIEGSDRLPTAWRCRVRGRRRARPSASAGARHERDTHGPAEEPRRIPS